MQHRLDRSVPPARGLKGKLPEFRFSIWTVIVFLIAGTVLFSVPPRAAAEEVKPDAVRVEVFLAKGHTKESEAIGKGFGEVSVRNVHFQYFRAGHPPANIAIGRSIPAPIARLAIGLAGKEAEGIKFIVPQPLLPSSWIGIGTSAFDEKNLIPITPENLKRLADPKLSSDEFHTLYNEFAEVPKIY